MAGVLDNVRSLSWRGVSCTSRGLEGPPDLGASVRLELRGVCAAVVAVAPGDGLPVPTSVSVLGPDEEPAAGLPWKVSRHVVFRRLAEHANQVALPHFAGADGKARDVGGGVWGGEAGGETGGEAGGEAGDVCGASALECLLFWLAAHTVCGRGATEFGLELACCCPCTCRWSGPGPEKNGEDSGSEHRHGFGRTPAPMRGPRRVQDLFERAATSTGKVLARDRQTAALVPPLWRSHLLSWEGLVAAARQPSSQPAEHLP